MTRRARRRILVSMAVLLAAALLVVAGAGLWIRGRMVASLPIIDGSSPLPGLAAGVRVSRDALGVPTVEGSSRIDVARATGWVHAQDRFFQMDLLRRKAAGELAELFGPAAVPIDKEARMHGFRRLAREVIARESPEKRGLFEAYAEGVNAGLAALRSKPWEYAVLRLEPRRWSAEDSVLIHYAMTLDLQESTGRYVRSLSAIRDQLGPASFAFFAPLLTPTDAALDGSAAPLPRIPPPTELDLRHPPAEAPVAAWGRRAEAWEDRQMPGSNSFAVAGPLAADGAALVANDMHLHLTTPNIWYRMSLKWPGHEETGVTLPGILALIAGSTGKVAWGFTNSNAGTGDIVLINPSVSPELYHGPKGEALVPYERRTETIAVKGSKPVTAVFNWTAWGPVVGEEPGGQQLVYHWTEDDPAATNLDIMDLEDARDAAGALAIANHMGIPAQNFVVADSSGRIGWTIAGFLPKRIGYDGRLPVSWTFGDRRWDGYLAASEVPTVLSPDSGYLWTANNRTMGGSALGALGDSGYDIGARARQIRDDLDTLVHGGRPVQAKDLLAIQLDDRAVLLGKWHDLLLQVLGPDSVALKSSRGRLLEAAGKWDGRADVASVGYRVVRSFRLAVAHRVLDPIFAPCVEHDPGFNWNRLNYEQPLEALVHERPLHLLDPAFASWDGLLEAAADDVSKSYEKEGLDPRTATWGQRNTAMIDHPFARLLPRWAASLIGMPADLLPGDSNMPRVQDPSFGASERFVVSPGHEASGIFHMPGGQVANPLSPFFRAGHEDWVRGDPTSFLPGAAVHTLELSP